MDRQVVDDHENPHARFFKSERSGGRLRNPSIVPLSFATAARPSPFGYSSVAAGLAEGKAGGEREQHQKGAKRFRRRSAKFVSRAEAPEAS